ncbi:N-acetylmuramoyl-L-alanine amidase [Bacillus sp. FJAT-52991]|uniref:N-acetylmuramoyl-L-alanine amidase n=1 Tax=Bacillus kandeliae TaxID=3129297 RepID=A0ABZ2N2M0_9BACI
MPTVVIDFGHGYPPDVGAVGQGLQEYKMARQIGEEVIKRLPSNIKVILTRKGDSGLRTKKSEDLNARCAVANNAGADLFVSIHLNAFDTTKRGYETCVYKEDVKNKAVHVAVSKIIKKYGLTDRGIKIRPDIRVLKGTKMSACLLECLFIDNKQDMDMLKNKAFFADFCQAIADGICNALGMPNKPPVKPANNPKKEEENKVEYKKDAAASPRFREAQKWVKENGISDGTYPQRPVTREEVWEMMYRASKVNK